MAPPQEEERHEQDENQAGVKAGYDDDAPNDKLLEMMAGLSIYNQQQSAVAALPRLWEEDDAAPAPDRFSSAFLGPAHRGVIDPRAHAPPPPMWQEAGPSAPPPQMHPASVRRMPLPSYDRRFFSEGRFRRSIARGPRNEPAAVGMLPTPAGAIAAARGAHPGGHAYVAMAPPPYLHGGTVAVNRPPGNEEALLLALSEETPESIVSYACDLLESRHGQRLFRLVFNHCSQQLRDQIVATVTRDRKRFVSLCNRRCLIEYRTLFFICSRSSFCLPVSDLHPANKYFFFHNGRAEFHYPKAVSQYI